MRAGICATLVGIIAIVGCTKGQGATPDTTQAQAASAGNTAAMSTSLGDARHAIDSMDKKLADALAHADIKTEARRQGRTTEGALSHRLEAPDGRYVEDGARLRHVGSDGKVARLTRGSAHRGAKASVISG